MFLDLTRSGLRLVKLFLGGQTVRLGKSRSEIGRVSMVVVMGLLAQLENDCWIRLAATEKPAVTIPTQISLTSRLVREMWSKPWMVEFSRNSLATSMVYQSMFLIFRFLFVILAHKYKVN